MGKSIWRVTSIILPSLCMVALFVLSMPTPKAKAELQEFTATVEQLLTINIPAALSFNIEEIDGQWHEIPFQVGISSNNKTGYTFVSDVASSMSNSKYSRSIALDEKWNITYPSGAVQETKTHVTYPNSGNSALDKKYSFKFKVLADSYITNGTYTGAMTFSATANPYPTTIAYIDYLDQISNDIVLTMTPGKYYQLRDRRDNKKYWIILQDGEVKMAQNLDYDISSSTSISSSDTNITSSYLLLSNSTLSGGTLEEVWVNDTNAPQSYDEGVVYRMSDEDIYSTINACVSDGYTEWECYRSAGGNYYNWPAAIASNNASMYGDEYAAESSICPKGWRLPTEAPDGFMTTVSLAEDRATAKRVRCEGIKPSHMVHIIVDDHYGHVTEKIKNNSAWGITSLILPKDFGYEQDNVHELAGWATISNATVPEYVKGALFETDKSEVSLYAVWRDKQLTLNDITTMQEMTPTIIKKTPHGTSKQLLDVRDNKKYWVTKYGNEDGDIIMTQNLDYDIFNTSLQSYSRTTSDVVQNKNYYQSGYDFDGGEVYYDNGTERKLVEDFAEDDIRWHYHLGNYYTYYNAKLGVFSTSKIDSTEYSICPKGWGIPTYSESQRIRQHYSNYNSTVPMYVLKKGGYLVSKDIVTSQESESRYLLNDAYQKSGYTTAYYMYMNPSSSRFDSNVFSSSNTNYYVYAYSLRCIARRDFAVNDPGTTRLEYRMDDRT